jgi:AcrR family transcriptional regulator
VAEPGTGSLRRTQAERSTATRHAILDATIRCLVDQGYAATSTTAIQQSAGVSRGALTHQFPSKVELMVAAVRHLSEIRTAALLEHARTAPRRGDRLAWVIRLLWEEGFDSDLFHAALELWTAARTDPALRAALQESERVLGRENREKLAPAFGEEIAGHPRFRRAFEVVARQMRGAVLTNLIRRRPPRTDELVAECVHIFRNELAGPR